MPPLHLTLKNIDAIRPADQRMRYTDTKQPGFILYVTPAGGKTFYVRRRMDGGRDREVKLGRFPDLTPEMARKMAAEKLGKMAAGVDPLAEARRQKASGTLAALFAAWLADAKSRDRRTTAEDERRFALHLSRWADRSPESMTKGEVRAWHQELGEQAGKTTANRSAELLARLYHFGANQDLLTCMSPTKGMTKFTEKTRDRVLTRDELPLFLAALDKEPNQTAADLFRLLLLTGARLRSCMSMRWDEVDFAGQLWRIPGEKMKNGEPHTIPLHPLALEIIERRRATVSGEWVLPSPGSASGHIEHVWKAFYRACKRANIKNLRIHDLRRTLGSLMADAGATTKQVGRTLGHQSTEATAVYERISVAPLRPLMDAALSGVAALMGGPPSDGEG